MKELTEKEKAQKYNEALERAKGVIEQNPLMEYLKKGIEYIFPELKESEDERIRKDILNYIKHNYDGQYISISRYDSWIAWLERQGEKKPVISDDALREGIAHFGITQYQIDNWLKKYVDIEKQGEQKPAVIIPKFRIGDEIKTSNEESLTITKIDEKGYWSENLFICDFGDVAKWELVEQKPAEWSEEDEAKIVKLKSFIAQCRGFNKENRNKAFDLIDSIKLGYTWKPSETQLETLKELSQDVPIKRGIIEELLEQLKKLREE